jgi:hypothetical protein
MAVAIEDDIAEIAKKFGANARVDQDVG